MGIVVSCARDGITVSSGRSQRSRGPFIAINCAAIPVTLLESELFGHERGAFTGADRRRIGKFEQCHGGTLFLDEVGDMAPGTQAKILRLLQEGHFQRVGGTESISVDVRVIAATNQNLDALIEQGRFRKDLYYRLRGVTIHLPPLRERREDIPELAHYFLFRYNRQLGTSVHSISPEALEVLQRYDWPGNVRELYHTLERAFLVGGGRITAELLTAETAGIAGAPPALNGGFQAIMEQAERRLLENALRAAGGNKTAAAAALGMKPSTFRDKLAKHGLG